VDLMLGSAGATGIRLAAVVVAASLFAGCQLLLGAPRPSGSPEAASPWGPLAVVEGGDFGMDAELGPGRLNIARRCVTLRGGGSPKTLVWPSEQTQWIQSSSTILFQDRDLGQVELHDGMTVRLSGGDPDLAPDLVWLAPLAMPCADALFLVTQVVIDDPP
jgi:hypothetical protein